MTRSSDEILIFPLNELNFQSKYMIKRHLGFSGAVRAGVLNWNLKAHYDSLRHYSNLYNRVVNELEKRNRKNLNLQSKKYISQKIREYPALNINDFRVKRTDYILLAMAILFFPLFLVLLYQSLKKANQLIELLTKILLVNSSIIKAYKNPEWTNILTREAILN